MLKRLILTIVLCSLVAFSSLSIHPVSAQSEGTHDEACYSGTDDAGDEVSLVITVPDNWNFFAIDYGVTKFDDYMKFLSKNKVIVKPGTPGYTQMKNAFPTYLCAAASPDGNNLAVVQFFSKAAFKKNTRQTIEDYLTQEGYEPSTGNDRPVMLKVTAQSPSVTSTEVVYLISEDASSDIFFEVTVYAPNELWTDDLINLSQVAVSLRSGGEDIDTGLQETVSELVTSQIGGQPEPTATPKKVVKPTAKPKVKATATPEDNNGE